MDHPILGAVPLDMKVKVNSRKDTSGAPVVADVRGVMLDANGQLSVMVRHKNPDDSIAEVWLPDGEISAA